MTGFDTGVVYLTLGAAGALVLASVVAGLYSTRAGLSFLLVFLVAGMLAGEDGPGRIRFDNFTLVFWVGNAALAVILLDGGLRTPIATFRTGLVPASLLATLGVLLTALVTGAAVWALLGLDWRLALLAGAVVGSTDAAAVFSLMRSSGLQLSERLASTLEIESGLNDPMAVVLTLLLIGTGTALLAPGTAAALLAQQFGSGIVLGGLCGAAMGWAVVRLPLAGDQRGLTALVLMAAGLAVFGGTAAVGGSGFLAVYLFALIVRAMAERRVDSALSAMDGYAWLAQASMFLLLGLLVTPTRLLTNLLPALGVALVLMVVARPLAVALCLAPMRFTRHEIGFVSWVGLRGAVPIVLAVFPVVSGVPGALALFDLAFVVVLSSLLLQGSTMRWAANRLGVNLPAPGDESAERAAYGDFAIDPAAPMADVCAFYGLRVPPGPPMRVDDWLVTALRRPPVVGDAVRQGPARFVVRRMDGARVGAVGLRLPSAGSSATDRA